MNSSPPAPTPEVFHHPVREKPTGFIPSLSKIGNTIGWAFPFFYHDRGKEVFFWEINHNSFCDFFIRYGKHDCTTPRAAVAKKNPKNIRRDCRRGRKMLDRRRQRNKVLFRKSFPDLPQRTNLRLRAIPQTVCS